MCFNCTSRKITGCYLPQERIRHFLGISNKLERYLEVDFEASQPEKLSTCRL